MSVHSYFGCIGVCVDVGVSFLGLVLGLGSEALRLFLLRGVGVRSYLSISFGLRMARGWKCLPGVLGPKVRFPPTRPSSILRKVPWWRESFLWDITNRFS